MPNTTIDTEKVPTTTPDTHPVRYNLNQLYDLPIDLINADINQPRKGFDDNDLASLAASVKKLGILQPIICRQDPDGVVFIMAGERRSKAAKQAGLTVVPVIFKDGDADVIAIVENMLRSDFTPVEEAEALQRLKNDHGYKSKELCDLIGKAESTVSEILKLNSLPAIVRDEIRAEKKYTRAELISIVSKDKDDAKMLALFTSLKNSKNGVKKPVNDGSDALLKLTETYSKKLTTYDVAVLDDAKRETVIKSLTALGKLIGLKTDKK